MPSEPINTEFDSGDVDLRSIDKPLPRPEIMRMHAYVPGEQPSDSNIVKLNTNENPYPPSPKVLEAFSGLTNRNARCYPNPTAKPLREAIAKDVGLEADQILIGNGSDEILKLVALAYVEGNELVGYLWPTYSLYPVFVEQIGASEYRAEWLSRGISQEEALEIVPDDIELFYLTNPNPPIGLPISLDAIRRFALARPRTLVIVDEAYIEFGGESSLDLIQEGLRNVCVSRTFSKSHSLAGMRVGFLMGPKPVIDILNRIRDSYNINSASQAAALAAWQDKKYLEETVRAVTQTREATRSKLIERGFEVEPSNGNFLFAKKDNASEIFEHLKSKKVFVRYFNSPGLSDGIRITIGTDAEMTRFFEVLDEFGGSDER